MKVKGDKLITGNFVISMISVLAQITALVLRIAYSATGWNSSYSAAGCASSYNNMKYGYTYLSLRAHFIASIFAIVAGIVSILLLLSPLRTIYQGEPENNADKNKESQRQVHFQAIYVCTSLCLLGQSLAAAGPLSIWVQLTSCTLQLTSSYILIAIASLLAFALMFITWIMLICLLQNQVQNQIRFQDLKIKGEEEQLSRKMDEELRDYIYNMNKNRAEMQQQLLHYEQRIYETSKKSQDQHKNSNLGNQLQQKEESQYQYYYEEVEGSAKASQIQQKQNKKVQDGYFQPSLQLSPSLAPSLSRKGDLQRTPNLNGEYESNDVAEGQLNSPRSRRLGAFQKSSSNSPRMPKKVQVINEGDNGWDQLSNFRLEAVYQPISQQMEKLLKITFFDNSPLLACNRPKLQQECPLQKYLQRDMRYEIPQQKVYKKNRKIDQSKEELIFIRKRKEYDERYLKRVMKQEFDESLAIKIERQEWLNSRQLQNVQSFQQENKKNKAIRYKKFNIVESIRSKYQD